MNKSIALELPQLTSQAQGSCLTQPPDNAILKLCWSYILNRYLSSTEYQLLETNCDTNAEFRHVRVEYDLGAAGARIEEAARVYSSNRGGEESDEGELLGDDAMGTFAGLLLLDDGEEATDNDSPLMLLKDKVRDIVAIYLTFAHESSSSKSACSFERTQTIHEPLCTTLSNR